MAENTQHPGVAVVTGAAGGMGQFIVRQLHAEGNKVYLADIDIDKAADLAAELSPDGSTARAIHLDVAKRQSFVDALAEITAAWGTPTILVNNAAVTKAADLMTLDEVEFNRILSINVDSIFFGCQVIGAAMAEQGYGRIINMASLAGQNGGTATGGHYAASKGAILTTTKVFARELAGKGVTVNAISPGPHDLPIVHQTVPAEKLDSVIAGIPVQRLGNPAFIAKTVSLLADEDAAFVTGACWDINGGLYVR
ncbi:3-oxoacyl-[acyl-carrier-protein] reductase FabG [Corynebacterium occultum]|uniref:3-oxoacyl-[acyl-carrier-protein] reductase FabG n=1 Tax=Corynebacterium occultum TaxID=2675219 RepID=A0A6B8VWW2_9CORY|nr:SDR family oxidoreductase [Corynebacterium occultum]QGU08633.1 3-oxoacyl-[acyl-carrier-protein] reductase FabG [Corynebacterium occultum]